MKRVEKTILTFRECVVVFVHFAHFFGDVHAENTEKANITMVSFFFFLVFFFTQSRLCPRRRRQRQQHHNQLQLYRSPRRNALESFVLLLPATHCRHHVALLATRRERPAYAALYWLYLSLSSTQPNQQEMNAIDHNQTNRGGRQWQQCRRRRLVWLDDEQLVLDVIRPGANALCSKNPNQLHRVAFVGL